MNNPLKFIDPDGHKVVCAGSANDCQQAIAAATGNADAAARFGTTTTTPKHSFLGIHWTTSTTTIAISGDLGSFRALGQNASRLADLVSDRREFGFNASSSNYKGEAVGFWNSLLMIAGHAAVGAQGAQNKQDSLDAENAVRRIDPHRGQKMVHHED